MFPTWIDRVDFARSVDTLRLEARQDWYRDPWNWEEYNYLRSSKWISAVARLRKPMAASSISPIVVPKENFGMRPAVLLDIVDRVCYQVAVDSVSVELAAGMQHDVYGWRLTPTSPIAGRYARNDYQWKNYRGRLGALALEYGLGLKTDISSFFASIDVDLLIEL